MFCLFGFVSVCFGVLVCCCCRAGFGFLGFLFVCLFVFLHSKTEPDIKQSERAYAWFRIVIVTFSYFIFNFSFFFFPESIIQDAKDTSTILGKRYSDFFTLQEQTSVRICIND